MTDATLKPPVEEGGEVEKACQACHTPWPEGALDPQTGICPDCQAAQDHDESDDR